MDSLVEKRKIFLEKLEKRYKKFERLLTSPNIYSLYFF